MPSSMNIEQGSTEWHLWRLKGIGASESACLLGADPYGMTPYKLWLVKTGKAKPRDGNESIFLRGHEVEDAVRAGYEFDTGLTFAPACFEHPEYPFIRASLDGWNDETKRGIEIKMVGAEAINDPIARHHMIQVQHQMLVTATNEWTFIRDCRGNTQVQTIYADLDMQRHIGMLCCNFWECVTTVVAPAFTDEDWVPDENPDLAGAVQAWQEATTTKDRKYLREDILNLVARKRKLCRGVKISRNPDRLTEVKDVEL